MYITHNEGKSVIVERYIIKLLKAEIEVNDKVRITKNENIFRKGYTENWSSKIFIMNSVLKTNPWTYKLKDLNERKY